MASGSFHDKGEASNFLGIEGKQFNSFGEDVICPICLDTPHNGVLLQCSSYTKGCRAFICDTDDSLSNCLDRYKSANGLPVAAEISSTATGTSADGNQIIQMKPEDHPTCPLCRGEVSGWVVIDELRMLMNMKKRCCQESHCSYFGNYMELRDHAKLEHPQSQPSMVDPVRQQDWENFQESSEIIDVLSTIYSEVPHGVVLGDYVVEYGDESGDEFEDFPGDEGNWWTSCILYHVFDNFRTSRNRRRTRENEIRRNDQRTTLDVSSVDEGSTSSTDISDYRFDASDEEFGAAVGGGASSRRNNSHRSYRMRRSRFQDA